MRGLLSFVLLICSFVGLNAQSSPISVLDGTKWWNGERIAKFYILDEQTLAFVYTYSTEYEYGKILKLSTIYSDCLEFEQVDYEGYRDKIRAAGVEESISFTNKLRWDNYTYRLYEWEGKDVFVGFTEAWKIDAYINIGPNVNMIDMKLRSARLMLCGENYMEYVGETYGPEIGEMHETSMTFWHDGSCTVDGKMMTYRLLADNKLPRIIMLSDGRMFAFQFTKEGMNLIEYEIGMDLFKFPTEGFYAEMRVRNCEKPRWDFLTREVIDNVMVKLAGRSLWYMHNELFAKYGAKFGYDDYDDYYKQFKWYKPTKTTSEIKLNDIERWNTVAMKWIENNYSD